jgi:RNA polymerase sigma-70 factor, ECF subfamily
MAVIAEITLRGNPEARFEDVYAACQPRVFRTCLAILRNTDDAAEATQEVFSRALPLLTQVREPHVWLQTVARNYCLDQLRRQKVRGLGTTLDEDTPGSPRDDPEREALLRDALRQAFEALNPRERRALGRVLLMDDSLADIAGMLGVSYSAAAQVVSRARRRAALAARAVIGASLAWLARLGIPRSRGRVTRAASQLFESGQHVLLAAAVLFTAGSLARPVHAGASAHTDGHPVAATAVGGPVAGADVGGVPPALAAPVAVAAPRQPLSALPSGYHAIQTNVTVGKSSGGNGSNSGNNGPAGGGMPYIQFGYQTGGHCASVSAGVGFGAPNVVNQTQGGCY